MLRRTLDSLISRVWLRGGMARRVLFGPYQGLTFGLSAPMATRHSVYFRAYEPNVQAMLDAWVRPGMTVYVVGAHVGLHVLYCAKRLGGQGKVVAFEGWQENFEGLLWNVRLNPQLAARIEPVNVCIAREPGTVLMEQGGSDGKHHIADMASGRTVEVAAVSLDAYFAEHPDPLGLLLIDIEGFELPALQGGEALIAACQPTLILEHHNRQAELLDWLRAHDYTVRVQDKRHILAVSRARA